ncbi:MAG TPA: TonB-dependent receptor [Thermoanaerobaculia bacterium]
MKIMLIASLLLCSFVICADVLAAEVEPERRSPAGAEAPAKDEKPPIVKETMVVTATRSSRAVSEVPMSTSVIGEEEIESSSTAVLDDLLRTITGLHMPLTSSEVTGTAGQRFSMRGLGGNRALVLLDGVPMHDAYHGTVAWQRTGLSSIQQIEVVRGGNASLFGNYALGGTVNVITRPVQSNEIRLDLSLGSFSTSRAALNVDHKVSDALGLRLSHDLVNSDGYYTAVNPGAADVPVWNDKSATSLRADYTHSLRTTGFLKVDFAKMGLSRGTVGAHSDRDMLDIVTGLRHGVGEQGLISANVFRQSVDLQDFTSANLSGGGTYRSNESLNRVEALGGSLEWSGPRSGVLSLVSLGLDVQEIVSNERLESFNTSGATTQEKLVRGRQMFAGLFSQASWKPAERLEILASARLDYYENTSGREITVGGPVTDYPEESTTQFDPRVSMRYAVSDRSALRAAVYRAFNAPRLRELYRYTQTGNTIILNNPFLEPETMKGGEVGYDRTFARGRFEMNLYWSEIDGFVLRGPVAGAPANVIQYVNVGTGRSQGVETMADLQLARRWHLSLGYTWADSKIVSNPTQPEIVGNLIPEVVPHIGTVAIRYRGAGGLSADLRWRTMSKSYGEPTNALAAPAHNVLDASVSRPVTSWLDVFASVNNALDEKYFYVLTPRSTRATEPRNITAGVRLRLGNPLGRGV